MSFCRPASQPPARPPADRPSRCGNQHRLLRGPKATAQRYASQLDSIPPPGLTDGWQRPTSAHGMASPPSSLPASQPASHNSIRTVAAVHRVGLVDTNTSLLGGLKRPRADRLIRRHYRPTSAVPSTPLLQGRRALQCHRRDCIRLKIAVAIHIKWQSIKLDARRSSDEATGNQSNCMKQKPHGTKSGKTSSVD